MVKNPEKLRAFEVERIKAETVDIEKNFRILDALYEEARMLGIFPPKDYLEGIEVKIRIARTVNCVQNLSRESGKKLARLGGTEKNAPYSPEEKRSLTDGPGRLRANQGHNTNFRNSRPFPIPPACAINRS